MNKEKEIETVTLMVRRYCRAAWLKEGRIEKTGGPELIEAARGDSAVP